MGMTSLDTVTEAVVNETGFENVAVSDATDHKPDGRESGHLQVPPLKGLQFKWLLFTGGLLAYIVFLILVVIQQRQIPLNQIEEYQLIQTSEEALIKADLAAFHVVTALFVDLEEEDMNAIEALAGGIAHEINNPISCIEGLANLLQEDARSGNIPDGMLDNIAQIVAYSTGLTRIMRDLQVIATPCGDEYQLIDLNQLISHTSGLLQYSIGRSNISVDLRLDKQLPAIYGLEDQLSLVIANILENAMDALKTDQIAEPKVVVSTGLLDGEKLFVKITDNGHGMDEHTLSHLFEPFYTTRMPAKGTGLGLSLCDSIVTGHNAHMKIKSHQDVGTEIRINFPLDQD